MKTLIIFILGILLATETAKADGVTSSDRADSKGHTTPFDGPGFYFDSERQKYFSNGSSIFSIKAMDNSKYVDKIEISIDGSDFKPYGTSVSFKEEGLHQIRFRAVDPVSNWSPIQTFQIHVDKTAPKSQVVWRGPTFEAGGKLFVHPQSKMMVVSQDNLSGVAHVLWHQDTKISEFPASGVEFAKEGPYHFKFSAVDYVGNSEVPYDLAFFVDSTPPETKAEINGISYKTKDKMFLNTGATVRLSAEDKNSGVEKIEYMIYDGPVTTYTAPITITGSEIVIKYRAIDHVGNREEWKQFAAYLDTKPPKVMLSKVGKWVAIGGKIFANPNFQLQADVVDHDSGVKEILVSMDGKPFVPTKDKQFTFTAAGEHQFSLKASDQVGNVEESDPYTIVIDNKPPVTIVKSSVPMVEKEGVFLSPVPNRIELEASDSGVGVEKIEYSLDNNHFKTYTAPIDPAQWANSKQTIYYRAVDQLGNQEATKKVDILAKSTGPNVELFVESEKIPNIPLSKIAGQHGRTPAKASLKQESRTGEPKPSESKSNESKTDEETKKDK